MANPDAPESQPTESSTDSLFEEGFWCCHRGDYPAALPKLRQASAQGCGEASVLLGNIYRYGWDQRIPPDYDVAKQFYERAITQGCLKGHYHLADMGHQGHGSPMNVVTILQHLLEGFHQSEASLQLSLQQLFKNIINSNFDDHYQVMHFLSAGFAELKHLRETNSVLSRDNQTLKDENETLKLELIYRPGGPGYHQAKDDFQSLAEKSSQP
jgi:TPR repeat protein